LSLRNKELSGISSYNFCTATTVNIKQIKIQMMLDNSLNQFYNIIYYNTFIQPNTVKICLLPIWTVRH
jgi:hypothetical protein